MASLKAVMAAVKVAMAPGDGRAVVITDKVVLGASPGVGTPAVNDTIDFFVPAGTRVADLAFVGDDVDTNGAPTFAGKIGYRPVSAADGSLVANDAYFKAAGALFQSAERVECVFKPIKFEQDVYITITPTVVAATLNPANPEIHMVAIGDSIGPK